MHVTDQLLALCGALKWTPPHLPSTLCGWTESATGTRMLSDPSQDLNAIHEAEKALTDDQWKAYVLYVMRDCLGTLPVHFRLMRHATAAQCLEAMVRALGLWKDAS